MESKSEQVKYFCKKYSLPVPDIQWAIIAVHKEEGYVAQQRDIRIILSVLKYQDGKQWVHLSCSHADRLPNYETMCFIKDKLIGEERKAIQIHPPKSEHVNIHPYCLHLWSCLDGDPLPDFRIMGQI